MRPLLFSIFIFLTLPFCSFGQTTYNLDFHDPKNVVGAIFHAAKTEDFAILAMLCDPFDEGDGDVRSICMIAYPVPPASGKPYEKMSREEFISYFKTGKITGEVKYEGEGDNQIAVVPFWFNHPGGPSRSNETMRLIKRYGNWYLFGF